MVERGQLWHVTGTGSLLPGYIVLGLFQREVQLFDNLGVARAAALRAPLQCVSIVGRLSLSLFVPSLASPSHFRLVTVMSHRIGNVRVWYFNFTGLVIGFTVCFVDCIGIRPIMASCRRVGQNSREARRTNSTRSNGKTQTNI